MNLGGLFQTTYATDNGWGIILKLLTKKYGMSVWPGFIWLRTEISGELL
jgi:hypothetical protein